MRSLPLWARARRRSFLNSGGIPLWSHFRPGMEVLEDRRMLACEILFDNGTLLIVGDDTDNTVAITATLRGIHVSCDGDDGGTYSGTRAIQLALNGGHDVATFDAEPSLGAGHIEDADAAGLPEIVEMHGGGGADIFGIAASPTKVLSVDGGEDADTVQIHFGRLSGAVHVADGGTTGRDTLQVVGTQFAEKIDIAGVDAASWIVKWEGPDLNGEG
ncbi:MAG TPA: hypothetical protein VFB96_05065, partial [Pirellulaceae bacterium]|nr:hypothetical protein [Pirellulaceae bacterium]